MLRAGDVLAGQFEVVQGIGRGSMGLVFRARDRKLARDVAIKLLDPALAESPEALARFEVEGRALARLRHSGIATLFGLFEHEGRPFMAMEIVPGQTLDAALRRQGRFAWPEAIPILLQTLDALAHAHECGLVHRDLKLSNLMLSATRTVTMLDFGVARIVEQGRLTSTDCVVGTPHYMAPEQASGAEADARSDLYALGVVLFELIAGRTPFVADSEYDLLVAHQRAMPPVLSSLAPDVPGWLDAIVARALAKNPADRFENARAFRDALAAGLRAMPGTRLAPSIPAPHSRAEHPASDDAARRDESGESGRGVSVGRPFWHRVPPAAVGAGAGLALGILIFATAGATRPATMTAPPVEAPRAAVAPPLPPAPAPAVERDPSILNGVQREAPFVLDRYDRPEPVKAGPAGPAEAGSLKPTRARPGSRNRSIDPTRRRPAEGAATASASHSTASFGDVALMRDGDALEVRLVFEAAALEICHDDVVVEKWPYVKIRRAVYSTTSHKRWGGFAGQGTRHWATLEGPAGVLKMRLHKSNHAAVFAALRARGIGD